jgi:hypothetical protein
MAEPSEWWAVTKDGETLSKFPTQAAATSWLHNYQSSSIDRAVRYEGYDIVFVQDGRTIWSYLKDAIGARIAEVVAGKVGEEESSQLFESSVQQAMTRVFGFPTDVSVIGKSINSSFLPEGRKGGWTKPDPGVVLVFTEYGWVPDPWSGNQERDEYDVEWTQAANLLKQMGWPNASWDSINSGVQIMYWRPDSWFVWPEHMRAKK